MSRNIGLYYPVIGFKDDAWVKLSALYWDKLGRILPPGHNVRDSATVLQLTEELGFIKNFAPSDNETEVVGDMFLTMLDQYGENLSKKYSLISLPSKSVVSKDRVTLITSLGLTTFISGANPDKTTFISMAGPDNRIFLEDILEGDEKFDPTLAYILSKGKMSAALGQALCATQLAVTVDATRKDGQHVTFIGMHPKLTFVYMEVLAEVMAANRQLSPVTDNVLDHVAVSGYSLERLIQALVGSGNLKRPFSDFSLSTQEIEMQMVTIALQSVLPRNLAKVPTKKIVQLRTKHRDELTAFQTYIHDFVDGLKELQNIDDPKALSVHLEVEYDKKVKKQMGDLEKCLKSLAIETVTGVLNVRVAIPALIASTGIHLDPIVGSAGAVALSVFPVIRKKRQEADQKVHSTPTAYLMYAKEGLKPATVASQVVQYARRFILGV